MSWRRRSIVKQAHANLAAMQPGHDSVREVDHGCENLITSLTCLQRFRFGSHLLQQPQDTGWMCCHTSEARHERTCHLCNPAEAIDYEQHVFNSA